LNITGYGVLEAENGRLRLCEAGVVRGKSRGSLTKRLVEIPRRRDRGDCQPASERDGLEELYSHYDRPRTAILMGHARGVIWPGRCRGGHPVVHYAATQIKAHPDRQRPGAEVAGARPSSGS